MDMITILGVSPDGSTQSDFEVMQRFTAEMNRFYSLFNMKIEFVDYGKSLEKTDSGLYTVRGLQSTLVQYLKKSVQCFLVVYCKKEAGDELSMAALVKNLSQQKKTEFVAYYQLDDMNPIRSDISRRIAARNEKLPVPRENRARLSETAKQILNQGCAFDRQGNVPAANACFQQSLTIQRKLVLSDANAYMADLPLPLHNLASLSYRLKNMKNAMKIYEDTIKARNNVEEALAAGKITLSEEDAKRSRRMKAGELTNLGNIYLSDKKVKEAQAAYMEALELSKTIYEEDGDKTSRMSLADAYGNIAVLHNQEEQLDEAISYFAPMFELLKQQVEEDPVEAVKKKIGMCGNSLGILYMRKQRLNEAKEVFLYNYKLYEDLIQVNADEYEPPMALVSYHLGHISRALKQPQESMSYMQHAAMTANKHKEKNPTCKRIAEAIVQENANARAAQLQNAQKLEEKAAELRGQAKYQDAVNVYRQAAGFYGGLGGTENMLKMASLYDECGIVMWDYVQLEQAEAHFKNALGIYRTVAKTDETHMPDLSVALFNMGRFIEDTKDKSINEYFREALIIAEKYKDVSEKAMEIYENLEDNAEELKAFRTYEEIKAEQEAPAVPEGGFEILDGSGEDDGSEAPVKAADGAPAEAAEETVGEAAEEAVENEASEPAEEVKETAKEEEKPAEKKGFFGRLFGKK